MIHLKKNISLFLIISYAQLLSNNIDHANWAVIPKKKNNLHHIKKSRYENPYQYLKKLGHQAHNIWQKQDKTPHQLAQLYTHLFTDIDAQFLIELIDQILQSPEILKLITKSSYRNITGFLKIVLVSSDTNSWKLRLHIWDQDGLEDLHNHKWDFFSKIITGQIVQNTYDIAHNEIQKLCAEKYNVRQPVSLMPLDVDGKKPCPCKDRYALHATKLQGIDHDNIYLFTSSCTTIPNGYAYFMKNHIIHTIQPSADAVTFVFTSEQVEENSQVFLLDNHNNNHQPIDRYAPSISQEEVSIALNNLKQNLERYIDEQR